MKKIVLVLAVLLAGTLAWAGNDPNPADYTVNVHVQFVEHRGTAR